MSILDIFRIGKIKAELDRVKVERERIRAQCREIKRERDELRVMMSDVQRMEAYGLKKAIDVLKARKQEAEQLVVRAETAAAKRRQELIQQIKNAEQAVKQRLDDFERQIKLKNQEVIILDEQILLQSFGLYTPLYNLTSSDQYKTRLDGIRKQQADMVKAGTAAVGATEWTINGSEKEGVRMVKDYVKLILRSFNNECDASITAVKFNNIESIEKRIRKAFETLNKLGERMSITIMPNYLDLKLEEMRLAYEYEIKRQEEREELRLRREEDREQEKARREIEEAKARLGKEQRHLNHALERLEAQIEQTNSEADRVALEVEKSKIEQVLEDVEENIASVELREQNTRAGYVYVISNIGAFGENVYKIGVTRRFDPQERVDELGDASVPFGFDVHVFIFSDDAPALENALHKAFDSRRINLINRRREFFRVTLPEIERVVKSNFNKPVEFIKFAEAPEYRQSLALRERSEATD